MAAPTKNPRVLQASVSNPAGSTTTGVTLDLTTKFGGLATLIVTNGGTGPTIGCEVVIQHSRDATNWYDFPSQTMSTTASDVKTFNVIVPEATMYIRSVFRGNTGQAVTVEAYFEELTSIG